MGSRERLVEITKAITDFQKEKPKLKGKWFNLCGTRYRYIFTCQRCGSHHWEDIPIIENDAPDMNPMFTCNILFRCGHCKTPFELKEVW